MQVNNDKELIFLTLEDNKTGFFLCQRRVFCGNERLWLAVPESQKSHVQYSEWAEQISYSGKENEWRNVQPFKEWYYTIHGNWLSLNGL